MTTVDRDDAVLECFEDEEAFIQLLTDPDLPRCPSFKVCSGEQCQACARHVTQVYVEYKRTWLENKELKIRLQDSVKATTSRIRTLEYHVDQKQRFLDKQTQLVDLLSRDKNVDLHGVEGLEDHTSACERCVYHRDMWRRVRSINLEQQKRCEIESTNIRAMQQQQGKQLVQLKMMYAKLRMQYDELVMRRKDPFCRDGEILKLRHELMESRAMTAGYNRTAFNANNEARQFMEQLELERETCCELRTEVKALQTTLLLRDEMVDVLKLTASHESREARRLFTLGECSDLVCRNRRLEMSHRINMQGQQLGDLQSECEHLKDELTRSRMESTHWRKKAWLRDCCSEGVMGGGDGVCCEGGYYGHGANNNNDDDDRSDNTHDVDYCMNEKSITNTAYSPGCAIPAIVLDENDPRPLTVHAHEDAVTSGGSNNNRGFEPKQKSLLISNITPKDELTIRLQSLFELVPGRDSELDENDMYDEFMLDQEAHRREQILEQIFASCHHGSTLPETERRRFRQAMTTKSNSIRSCKRSFSACLRAIGGVMVKKRSRNIWLNFKQTRTPIFKWCSVMQSGI